MSVIITQEQMFRPHGGLAITLEVSERELRMTRGPNMQDIVDRLVSRLTSSPEFEQMVKDAVREEVREQAKAVIADRIEELVDSI